jgi:hypothetical protein
MIVEESNRQHDVTYYTVAEAAFFLGAVMLVNSLRVTGNDGKIVVVDVGLAPDQRRLLESHAEVVAPSQTIHPTPGTMKPYPYLLGATGTVVVIDSDIVVTARLDDALDLARNGKVVAAPAWLESVRHRWFAEWEEALELRAPLRREEWFHNGFVVVSTDRWPRLLKRWWEVCGLVPTEQALLKNQPFSAPDADSLNALMMSEFPRSALALLPEGYEAFGGDVVIENVQTLRCTLRGRPTGLLHYPDRPKPWQSPGWLRVGATAFAPIMRRLLFASDVPLRVEPSAVPLWLRPSATGRAALMVLAAANWTIGWASRHLPERPRNRVRNWRRTAVRRAQLSKNSTASGVAGRRRIHASAWGWAAVAATLVSAVGLVLLTIVDSVRTSAVLSLDVFWGLFTGDAVIAFLAGTVAVLTAWRSRRHDATLRFGLVGVAWLILAQSIEMIWK